MNVGSGAICQFVVTLSQHEESKLATSSSSLPFASHFRHHNLPSSPVLSILCPLLPLTLSHFNGVATWRFQSLFCVV